VVHPLAGQGLNLGLADARALTDAIARAVSVGADGALRRFVLRAIGCVLRVGGGRSRAAQALARCVSQVISRMSRVA
jgi:2-polyprenyl-6-methoxyphenol hydroxylase-like FAD-dependent oxidoreductase